MRNPPQTRARSPGRSRPRELTLKLAPAPRREAEGAGVGGLLGPPLPKPLGLRPSLTVPTSLFHNSSGAAFFFFFNLWGKTGVEVVCVCVLGR